MSNMPEVTVYKPTPTRKTWRLKWTWRGKTCSISGFRSRRASDVLAGRVRELCEHRLAGGLPDASLVLWIQNDLDEGRKKRLMADGIIDGDLIRVAVTLEQHIDQWEETLHLGNTDKYVQNTMKRVNVVTAGMKNIAEVTHDRVAAKLNELGRAGKSQATINHYTTAIKMFTRWMWVQGRIHRDPLAAMKRVKVTEEKRPRLELTMPEVRAIIEAANRWEKSEHGRPAFLGPERAIMYQLAVETGLRENEIVTLRVADLDVFGRSLIVRACNAKNGKKTAQPLRPEMMALLESHTASRHRDDPIFGANCRWATARALGDWFAKDRDAARVAKETDRGFADFHSFRHTFITQVGRFNDIKTTQELARHADPRTTVKYMHTDDQRLRLAVMNIPGVSDEDSAEKVG